MKFLGCFLISILFLLNCSDSLIGPNTNKDSDNKNSIRDAEIIQINEKRLFNISALNDTDYFKIDVTKGGLLRINCTNVPKNIDLYLVLQDIEMNDYTNYLASMGSDAQLLYSALPGTYYLMIKDNYNNAYSKQDISLEIQIDSLDTFEYNDVFTKCKQIELNNSYTSKIIPLYDIDHFSFNIDKSKIVRLQIDSISNKIDMYLEILDHEGVPVFDILATVGANIDLGVSLLKGNYILRLKDGYNNAFSEIPYHFVINDYLQDTCEWNNSFEEAKNIQLNTIVQGNIYPKNDTDFFAIEIPSNSKSINITVDSISSKIDMYVELYNNEKKRIKESNLGPAGSKVEVAWEVLPGKYYILLKDGYNTDFSEKQYRLEIK